MMTVQKESRGSDGNRINTHPSFIGFVSMRFNEDKNERGPTLLSIKLISSIVLCAVCIGVVGTVCLGSSTKIAFCEVPQFLEQINVTSKDSGQTINTAVGASLIIVAAAIGLPGLFTILRLIYSSKFHEHDLSFLYLQRFLSAWGDRMWEFAVPIIFIDMFQETLLPTSLYVLIVYIVVIQFLPSFGSWIDKESRLRVQKTSLIVENICTILSAIIICSATSTSTVFQAGGRFYLSDWQTCLWYIGLLVLGGLGELFNNALVISMDKDWVVVVAEESGKSVHMLNTWMRRIDLVCKALSPAAFAAIYQIYGNSPHIRVFYGSLTVGLWNLLSFPLELLLIRIVYTQFANLSFKLHIHVDGTRHSHIKGHKEHFHVGLMNASEEIDRDRKLDESVIILPDAILDSTKGVIDLTRCHKSNDIQYEKIDAGNPNDPEKRQEHFSPKSTDETSIELALQDGFCTNSMQPLVALENNQGKGNHMRVADGFELIGCTPKSANSQGIIGKFVLGMRIYLSQPIFLASFAYTMLYMTVLDNGGLLTSYLEWSGVPTAYIGIGRGVGAVVGLLGTVLYPLTRHCLSNSIAQTGLFSLWAFWISLAPIAAFMIFARQGLVVEYAIIVCVALSRMYLWMFDLAITELVQVNVPEEDRGMFSSVQTSSYQVFFILVHLAGVFSSDPRNFYWLIGASLIVVFTAAAVYTTWFMRHGKAISRSSA